MQVLTGDIWSYHAKGYWVVIPTNGCRKQGTIAVMGIGLALQAANKFPDLPNFLGKRLTYGGNHVYPFEVYRLFSFPTKERFWEKSDIRLIQNSLNELLQTVKNLEESLGPLKVALPKVGCGAGNLDWERVRPILEEFLDNRFTVVDLS